MIIKRSDLDGTNLLLELLYRPNLHKLLLRFELYCLDSVANIDNITFIVQRSLKINNFNVQIAHWSKVDLWIIPVMNDIILSLSKHNLYFVHP